jgi:hypothetical protein
VRQTPNWFHRCPPPPLHSPRSRPHHHGTLGSTAVVFKHSHHLCVTATAKQSSLSWRSALGSMNLEHRYKRITLSLDNSGLSTSYLAPHR